MVLQVVGMLGWKKLVAALDMVVQMASGSEQLVVLDKAERVAHRCSYFEPMTVLSFVRVQLE